MIKKHSFLAIVIMTAASIVCAQLTKPPMWTFADLQHYDAATQTFQIEGYVLDIYKCPPCPPRGMCKPCIADNVTLTDTDDRSDLSNLKRLRVFTEETDKFVMNGKYIVTVRVKGTPKMGDAIDSVDLISIDTTPNGLAAASPAGTWTGTSLCTVKPSPCHDEQVIYHITAPDPNGKLSIQADKLVNGKPDNMGTLECMFDKAGAKITCSFNGSVWSFTIAGDTMTGTLTRADGTLYRKISLKR